MTSKFVGNLLQILGLLLMLLAVYLFSQDYIDPFSQYFISALAFAFFFVGSLIFPSRFVVTSYILILIGGLYIDFLGLMFGGLSDPSAMLYFMLLILIPFLLLITVYVRRIYFLKKPQLTAKQP